MASAKDRRHVLFEGERTTMILPSNDVAGVFGPRIRLRLQQERDNLLPGINIVEAHNGVTREDPVSKKCTCVNTQCLKLYCDCFSAGLLCDPTCTCQSCLNNEDTPANRDRRNSTILEHVKANPNAFRRYPGRRSQDPYLGMSAKWREVSLAKGGQCACVKPQCLTKLCSCHRDGARCRELCVCYKCKNRSGASSVKRKANTKTPGHQGGRGVEAPRVNSADGYSFFRNPEEGPSTDTSGSLPLRLTDGKTVLGVAFEMMPYCNHKYVGIEKAFTSSPAIQKAPRASHDTTTEREVEHKLVNEQPSKTAASPKRARNEMQQIVDHSAGSGAKGVNERVPLLLSIERTPLASMDDMADKVEARLEDWQNDHHLVADSEDLDSALFCNEILRPFDDTEESVIPFGTTFIKSFGGLGIFQGKVVNVPNYSNPSYEVEYEDGDTEAVRHKDLVKLISKSRQSLNRQDVTRASILDCDEQVLDIQN